VRKAPLATADDGDYGSRRVGDIVGDKTMPL